MLYVVGNKNVCQILKTTNIISNYAYNNNFKTLNLNAISSLRIKWDDSCTVINSMFTSFMVSQLLVASKRFVNFVLIWTFYTQRTYCILLFGFHVQYKYQYLTAWKSTLKYNVLLCWYTQCSTHYIHFQFHFIRNQYGRTIYQW